MEAGQAHTLTGLFKFMKTKKQKAHEKSERKLLRELKVASAVWYVTDAFSFCYFLVGLGIVLTGTAIGHWTGATAMVFEVIYSLNYLRIKVNRRKKRKAKEKGSLCI